MNRGVKEMRRSKGSRRIVVQDVEYRWRAAGDDGYITFGIWPLNNIGPYIQGNFEIPRDLHRKW
jgi:hypothetical protein